MMPRTLKQRLIMAASGGAVLMATVLIQWHEGLVHTPYRNSGGTLTVCAGHIGDDVIEHQRYAFAECQELLDSDLKAALGSFVYNVGSSAFERSTLLKKLNAGDLVGACDEMRRWKYVDGKVSKGLVSRRAVERELCLTSL